MKKICLLLILSGLSTMALADQISSAPTPESPPPKQSEGPLLLPHATSNATTVRPGVIRLGEFPGMPMSPLPITSVLAMKTISVGLIEKFEIGTMPAPYLAGGNLQFVNFTTKGQIHRTSTTALAASYSYLSMDFQSVFKMNLTYHFATVYLNYQPDNSDWAFGEMATYGLASLTFVGNSFQEKRKVSSLELKSDISRRVYRKLWATVGSNALKGGIGGPVESFTWGLGTSLGLDRPIKYLTALGFGIHYYPKYYGLPRTDYLINLTLG